jgi:hypothetical protein
MGKNKSKIPVYSNDRTAGMPLGSAEIDLDEHKATISIDFDTPLGKQLLLFWEAYPDTLSLNFVARAGRPVKSGYG